MADESTTTEQKQAPETIKVRYEGNSEARNSTAVIKLSGRDDIPIGGEGEVTMDEFARLGALGLVLKPVDSDSDDESATEESAEQEAASRPAATPPTRASRAAASSSSTTGDGSAS